MPSSCRRLPDTRGRPSALGDGKASRTGKALTLPLTRRQEQFIAHWMVHRNATRAYSRAYPDACRSTAQVEGSRLFRDPRISSEIDRRLTQEQRGLRRELKGVVHGLAALAFSKISDIYDRNGAVISPAKWPMPVALAVKRFKIREMRGPPDESGRRQSTLLSVEVEFHDKATALRLLGEYCGLFSGKSAEDTDDRFVSALRESRKRSLNPKSRTASADSHGGSRLAVP